MTRGQLFHTVIFTSPKSYPHSPFLENPAILPLKEGALWNRGDHRKRQKNYRKNASGKWNRLFPFWKKKTDALGQTERYTYDAKGQLIEKLEEENRTLQEQAWKYLETMRQMLKDIHP